MEGVQLRALAVGRGERLVLECIACKVASDSHLLSGKEVLRPVPCSDHAGLKHKVAPHLADGRLISDRHFGTLVALACPDPAGAQFLWAAE